MPINELNRYASGTSARAYRALGAHPCDSEASDGGCFFRVHAPNAREVFVTGDFCGWSEGYPMYRLPESGVWEACVESAKRGDRYKYRIVSADGSSVLKSDPFGTKFELRPDTASVVWGVPRYSWTDSAYMSSRAEGIEEMFKKPMSIYEAHIGSWEKGFTYTDASVRLIRYCVDMGYTHIELLPLCEYPLDDSWGYQVSGYYGITARYGAPEELMRFVDRAHAAGLGVILDWVPAHFVKDEHGLRLFDGTSLFESSEPLRAEMPLWGTLLFDYSKPWVRSFLISNAVFLLDEFHIDGLRVDAVSCMLYHDFCKEKWLPEPNGSRENAAAANFIRNLNKTIHSICPGAIMIAEESSSFPLVTGDASNGGLGFDLKWNMGYMNDTLSYFETDSLFRKYHHDLLTFPLTYAFSEKYILPFSHDETVCGKRSLIGRMCGNYDAQFCQLRLLFAFQFASIGKKLMFMGDEFGQFIEWDFSKSLDWFLLDYPAHAGMQDFIRSLNLFYRSHPALWRDDLGWEGFTWLTVDDAEHSVAAFLRTDTATGEKLLCIFNFTPGEYSGYRVNIDKLIGHRKEFSASLAFTTAIRKGMEALVPKFAGGSAFLEIPLYGYEGAYYRIR